MVKALVFKGDKKPKKRKRAAADDGTAKSAEPLASVQPDIEVNPENDDSWVTAGQPSDVSGPLLIVLASEKPTALSCDATGQVFALAVENMVDGNANSAEPHDVRQVWVANRVAGTDKFRFKGAHGKFLSCDSHGLLSATSEAVSSLESFSILPGARLDTFHIQTSRGKFISATSKSSSSKTSAVEIRGDADSTEQDSTLLRLRMQARFKPRAKTAKEEKLKDKVSRKDLEAAAGRKLEDDEVRRLKRARREGDYHEQLLMLKVKGKHDKYSY
ncbi:hypothetical protein TD95_000053 [Thielaviopsis punctulata]|uniref:Actin-crosslinking protein n=1 Tax=Thielaviopsis punctulata TaxID=72032 RepID=A0A0F4Z7A8_9PEZI|nr:hypothetical protein TD95_000053 [Thielaviopsis punctulata]